MCCCCLLFGINIIYTKPLGKSVDSVCIAIDFHSSISDIGKYTCGSFFTLYAIIWKCNVWLWQVHVQIRIFIYTNVLCCKMEAKNAYTHWYDLLSQLKHGCFNDSMENMQQHFIDAL